MQPYFRDGRRRWLLLPMILVGAGTAWWQRDVFRSDRDRRIEARAEAITGIVGVGGGHRPEPSYTMAGEVRERLLPAVSEALPAKQGESDYVACLRALRALPARMLPAEQADSLRGFVADSVLPEGFTPSQMRAFKNEVLNLLVAEPSREAVVATAVVLREIYADKDQDHVIRDYAIQHLAVLAERESTVGWDTHWKAAEGGEPALAATALLHLSIRDRHGEFKDEDRKRAARAALRLAASSSVRDPARATALLVCGRLGATEVRSVACALAQSDGTGLPLRIAAVATLGDLVPEAATRDCLLALVDGSERRLRAPARAALEKLN